MDRNTQEDWERKAERKAKELVEEAESGLKDLVGKAREASQRDSSQDSTPHEDEPQGPSETIALEARPEEVKALYARILDAQCLVDGRLDPRELEYLYVFMSRVGLGSDWGIAEIRSDPATSSAISLEDIALATSGTC